MRNVPFPKATEINSHHSWTERPNCTLSPRWTPNFLVNMISREGEPRFPLKRSMGGRHARTHARTHAFRKNARALFNGVAASRIAVEWFLIRTDGGRTSTSASRPERLTIGRPVIDWIYVSVSVTTKRER